MLTGVTITGADDRTDQGQMADLTARFPFVEWGILMSAASEGYGRFPSRKWMIRLFTACGFNPNLSAHLCGQWVRDLLVGKLKMQKLPILFEGAQRVQVNTHAQLHYSTAAMFNQMATKQEWIIQFDGVNQHLLYAARGYGVRTATLFDASHGAGILPDFWPPPIPGYRCGYAGGIGPDNVLQQVEKLNSLYAGTPFWIDMETLVRTENDSELDMAKVERVLELCAPLIGVADGR